MCVCLCVCVFVCVGVLCVCVLCVCVVWLVVDISEEKKDFVPSLLWLDVEHMIVWILATV